MIFTSLIEGFGNGIIEAQACGCPVFAANRSPMNEGRPGVIYYSPFNLEMAANFIAQNWNQREKMRQQGLQNAVHYSLHNLASVHLKVYTEAMQ